MILTTRKRALVALIHTVAFLGLAIRDFAVASRFVGILPGATGRARSIVFAVVYLIVAAILGYLLAISRCATEQLYFGFCAASASTGLLRALAGDSMFPAGQYLRLSLLACAVIVGLIILKRQPSSALLSS